MGQKVEVTWLDAVFTSGDPVPMATVGIMMRTLGWVLRDDSQGIVIASERDAEGGYRRVTEIPRPYIRKVVYLAKSNRKSKQKAGVPEGPGG